jgi:chromosomal replication initiation ATPase DnaA
MKLGYSNIHKVNSTIERIVELYGVEKKEFLSKTKTNRLVRPRHMISCILSDLGYTSREIGELIGKDQSTVRYSIRAVKDWAKLNSRNLSEYKEMKKAVLA